MRKLVGKSPENVEKIARFPGGGKGAESCHVCGCHGFLVPAFASFLALQPAAGAPPLSPTAVAWMAL